MNLLEVERRLRKLDEREEKLRYYFDPRAKYLRGQR